MDNFNNSQEWTDYLNTRPFEERCIIIKNKILESDLDDDSKKYFSDSFDYVFKLYKQNKPLELSLFKIYLKDIKGYKELNLISFIRLVMLLGFCGFEISET